MILLIAFDSTHMAIASEKKAKAAGLKARLVPTPEAISASCGLALRVKEGDVTWARTFLTTEEKISAHLYELLEVSGQKSYQKIAW